MNHDLYCEYYRLGEASQTFFVLRPYFEKRFLCDHLTGSLHVNNVKTLNVQLQTPEDLERNFRDGALSNINLIIWRFYRISEFNLLWEGALNKELSF